jgi:hypothetical protein
LRSSKPQVRLRAAQEVLERLHGNPTQPLEVAPPVDVSGLTITEQQQLDRLLARVLRDAARGNTTLMGEGVNPKIVKERAGHASVAYTLEEYSWVAPDLQDVAGDALTRSLTWAPEDATGDPATELLADSRPPAQLAGGRA